MSIDTITLPDNINDLKSFFVDTQQEYENEIRLLKEKVSILQHRLFGHKSEKLSRDAGSGQLLLFNEVEQVEATPPPVKSPEEITVPAHSRRRGQTQTAA